MGSAWSESVSECFSSTRFARIAANRPPKGNKMEPHIIVAQSRRLRPDIYIAVRTYFVRDLDMLSQSGADVVVPAGFAAEDAVSTGTGCGDLCTENILGHIEFFQHMGEYFYRRFVISRYDDICAGL